MRSKTIASCRQVHRHRLLMLASVLFLSQPALADSVGPPLNLTIAAQPLGQALNILAHASGRALIVDAGLVAGRQAPALSGRAPLAEALRRLLAGSGLQWRIDDQGAIIVTAAPMPQTMRGVSEEQMLQDVVVQAAKPHDEPSEIQLGREALNMARSIGNAEIFSSQSNIQLNNIRNEGGAMDVGIRNLQGEGRVPIVIDGSLQSTHTNRGYMGASDRTYIDSDLISSARVKIGASNTPFSAGAIGGLVQVQTLEPSDVILEGQRSGVLIKGSAFNNNKTPRIGATELEQEYYIVQDGMSQERFRNGALTLAGAHRFERGDVLFAWSRRVTGNYFAGKNGHGDYGVSSYRDTMSGKKLYVEYPPVAPGQEVVNTGFSSDSFLIKSNLIMSDEQRLKLTWRRHTQEAGEVLSSYWRSTSTDVYDRPLPGNAKAMPQWAPGTADVTSYSAQYSFHARDSKLINLDFGIWGSDALLHQRTGALPLKRGLSYGDQYLHEFSNKRLGAHLVNHAEFDVIPLSLEFGVSLNQESIRPESSPEARNVRFKPRRVLLSNGQYVTEMRSNSRNADRTAGSLFAQAELRLGGHSLHLGSSVQSVRIDDHNINQRLSYHGLVDVNGRLTLRPYDWLDLFGMAARTWRPPSLHEGSRSAEIYNRSLDYPLHPEKARSYEIGGKVKLAGLISQRDRFSVQAKYFDNRIKNYLTQGDRSKEQDSSILNFMNYDRFQTRGTELSFEYQHPLFFVQANATQYREPQACSAEIAATLNAKRAENLLKGHRAGPHVDKCNSMGFAMSVLPSRIQPKKRYVITLGARLLESKLTLGTRLRYHSGKKNPEDWLKGTAASPIITVPASHLLDVFGEYRFNHQVSAGLHIANLTNRYQVDPGSLVSMPVPGRTIRLALEARF